MADRPQESEGHPVIAGLLALLGVGLAVGLLVSGAALAGTSVLGLGESDGGGQASSDQTINVPKPEPTEEQTGALITLEPKPSSEGDERVRGGTRARGRDLPVRGRHRGPARRADRPLRRLPRRRGRDARRPAPRGRRVGRLRGRRRDRDGQQRDVLHLRDHRAHRHSTPGGCGTPRPTRSPTRCASRSADRVRRASWLAGSLGTLLLATGCDGPPPAEEPTPTPTADAGTPMPTPSDDPAPSPSPRRGR